MAQVQPRTFWAAGRVTGATGAVTAPAANFMAPFTVVRNGAGDYTITFAASYALDATERCVQITARGTNDIVVRIGTETDTTIQVLTRTGAAAADSNFDFVVWRIGGGAG